MNEDLKSQFEADARRILSPVLEKYGFEYESTDYASVAFASPSIVLTVSYDVARSFEVGVDFQPRSEASAIHAGYTLGEVYRCFSVPDADRKSFCLSSDYDMVRQFLVNSIATLDNHCAAMLEGDPAVLSRIREQRERESCEYTAQLEMSRIRPVAEEAWRNKDYAEYIRLLEGVAESLSETERKKLSYARRKQGHS